MKNKKINVLWVILIGLLAFCCGYYSKSNLGKKIIQKIV